MNDSTIFDKTTAGDEAIREKTRLVQRNLRLVLVLVNGIADVASLKRSLGDPAMVESALIELERLGLIESEEACAKRLAQLDDEKLVSPDERPLVEAQTVFDEELATQIQVRAVPAVVPRDEEPPKAKNSPLAAIPNWIEGLRTSRARAQEEALYERAYGGEGMDHAYADPVSIDPSMAPLPPERRFPIRPGVLVKRGLAVLSVLVIALVVFYPYENYQPDAEKRLTEMLGDTVKVGSLQVTFLPPAIVLDQVSVGAPAYAEASRIRLLPAWTFLFSGWQFRKVELDGLRLKEGVLPHLGGWFKTSSMGDVEVGRVAFTGASIDFGGRAITGLFGDFSPADGISQLTVGAAEGKVHVDVVPKANGVALRALAMGWQTPFQPSLDLTRLDLQGELSPGRFDIQKVEALLYDGSLVGKGGMAWSASTASVNVNAEVEHLASARLLAGMGAGRLLDGDADGKLSVSGSGVRIDALDTVARIDGDFKIAHGSLKLDLVEAMRSKMPVRGGQMRFESFAGTVASDAGKVRLNNLRLTAGFLRGGGQAVVSRQDGALSGAIRLDMRGGAEGTGGSLTLDGSTDRPVLRPSR